ncbi:MAG: hypothetical protein H6745_07905 [Deltaproteobacteria bacterium]|nr:hypothetical protein [Deltaproteobacteria bacterium]
MALWAREALGAPEPEDLARQLAAWRSDPAPTSQLAALRVALRRGDLPVARELLDASGARMLATGLGVALWQLMEPLTDSLVTDWRDVVAVDVGAIDELDDDAAQEVSLRIARAKLLGLRGDHAAAFAVAQRVWDDATAAGDPAGRVRAALVLAPSLINAGEHRRVATLLEDLRADTLHDRLSLASYRATALAFLDQEDQAAALLRSALEPHAEELGGLPMSVRHRIAGACFVLDERAWVRRLVAPEIDGALSASLLPVRFALVHAALCAIENGQLDEAATLAARLAPTGHDGVATYADFHELIVRVELAFAKGELRVAQAALQAARDVPRRRVDDEHVTLVNTLRALHAAEPPTAPAPAELGEVASQLAVATARHHLRHDPRVSWPTLPRWLTTHRRTRRALPLQLRAEHALLAGDTAAALRHAEQALREARNGGLRIVEGELTGLMADLHAIDGRWADMVAAARELADLATATGAPRFAADAALYEAIGAPDDGLDWAALERVAADLEPSPVSSRRARALLAWDEVPLDRVDELVLARVARDHGPAARRVIGRDVAAGPRWGLDLGRRDVWSAAAGWLALPADGVGWRLLERLGEGDGWADNEALVSAVWGVEKYKPHVHDNRLHVAVYKLRRALAGAGDAAAAADHIVRDGDGYALAGRCLVVTRG